MAEKFSPEPEEWAAAERRVDEAERSRRQVIAAGRDISDPDLAEAAAELKSEHEQKAGDLMGDAASLEHALAGFRMRNLIRALREEHKLEQKRHSLLERQNRILAKLKNPPSIVQQRTLEKVRKELQENEEKMSELKRETPEAYFGLNLRELKKYKEQLASGKIVETPYVREQAEDIVAHVQAHRPVLIYGHLGSGKTELAMHIARNYILKGRADAERERWAKGHPDADAEARKQAFQEIDNRHSALVVSGSKYTSLAELYGHQTLAVDQLDKGMVDSFASEMETKLGEWKKQNPDASEEELNRAHERIIAAYNLANRGGTVTDFFLGPIYRAMEEGRPVIIDEVNAIPHEVLISLNHILTRKPGDVVNVQQDSGKQVTIQEGFCIIMTGNLNQGQEMYVDRQDMDPAFLSRLYKKEYDYLPQTTEGILEDGAGAENELFTLLLARTMDKNGNLQVPPDTLRKLWKLSQVARVTQNVFAGKEVNSAYYFREGGGRSMKYLLKESVLSLRALGAIIGQWQGDAYAKELDYYLWKEFVSQSTVPADRAYLYQLLKDQFGFFKSYGWEQDPSYGTGGNIRSFNVKAPTNTAGSTEFIGPRETVMAAFGKPPERAKWPEVEIPDEAKEPEVDQEALLKLEEFKDNITKAIDRLAVRVEQLCTATST